MRNLPQKGVKTAKQAIDFLKTTLTLSRRYNLSTLFLTILMKIICGFVDNPKRNHLLCCNKIAETMNSNVIFYGLAKIFQGSFLFFEFIQNKLIEVQIRPNLDFRWGNTISIPVWRHKMTKPKGFKFIKDEDYHRIGFFIK